MRTLFYSALAALLAVALAGCVIEQPYPQSSDYQYQPASAAAPAPEQTEPEEQAAEPPPAIPEYDQPACPVEGYLWTPGLWRWGPEGYFWVPGTWVAPPQPGLLWTPGYWGAAGALYVFHPGHWGAHVGYYGGIRYGGGYDGDGYHGGRWVNNRFQYNTSVTRVNVTTVHNTYRENVFNNEAVRNPNTGRTSYVGGEGTRAQPMPHETQWSREPRFAPTPPQQQHHVDARSDPTFNAARNEGHPPIAATPHPSAFRDPGVTPAKPVGPAYHPQRPIQRDEKPGREERDRGHQ